MFLEFFGMREQPFGVTPDPRFLYLSPAHREALASLYYGVEAGRGFLSMIARPGMGKTTLLFQLLEEFRNAARTAFLFQTQCDSREFIRFLLAELGIESKEQDRVKMHEEFNAVLLREMKAGKRFVVVIDEAQNLDDSVLETVRLLSNFETPRAKLMQIILSGQPELADKLSRPNLVQLRQRISIVARLDPLSPQHVHEYIQHRLRLAGYQGPRLFLPDGESALIERSEGIPRTINNLCFNALSLAYAMGRRQIDRRVIEEISGDLDLETIAARPRSPQFHIPFNTPVFAHTSQWVFEPREPEPVAEPETEVAAQEVEVEAATIADVEVKQLMVGVGARVEVEQPVAEKSNGAKAAAVATKEPVAVTPQLLPIFTASKPSLSAQSAVTPKVERHGHVPAKTALRISRGVARKFARQILFTVLAVDIVLGAIFVMHRNSRDESNASTATAAMSFPNSSSHDGMLVTDDGEHQQADLPVHVSVPESTMRDKIIRMVPPTPPADLAKIEKQSVRLEASIGRSGEVRDLRVLEGNPELAEAAKSAVMQWRYKPYLVNGRAADVETQITVDFSAADTKQGNEP